MPELVAAALVASGYFTAGALITTFVSYAIVLTAAYAYGTYQANQAKRAARDSFNASLKDRLVMTATTDAPRSRVYGEVRNCDGILFKATHGTKSEFYTFVVAIAGHEIDSFTSYWFSDQVLTLDGSGYVLTAPFALSKVVSDATDTGSSAASGSFTLTLPATAVLVAGSVSGIAGNGGSGVEMVQTILSVSVAGNVVSWSGGTGYPVRLNYQYSYLVPKARVRSYTGGPAQDISADLIALGITGITSAHKFNGIALLLVTLEYDVDAFAQGVPAMSAVVRGAKIFDPRTSTTAWSRNPALIARDWALYPYGGGATSSEVVDATVITAANACDVTHAFVSDIGTTTRPMYVCDIVCPTQGDPTQSLQEIVSAMAGKYAWAGGLLRFKAGAYSSSVATLDETWLSGASTIDIQQGVSRSDLVNIYRPSIADASKGYVVTPTEPVRATAYITADGQELPRDVTFLGIIDSDHAQHVAGVLLRDARQGLSVKVPCNLKAYPVEIFDTIAVTLPRFGWAAKEFEVLSWDFTLTGGVNLTLKETAASIFDPDAMFTTSDASPNTNLPLPWNVPSPSSLFVDSGTVALTDGSILVRAHATWTFTDLAQLSQGGRFELQYRKATDSPTGDWPSENVEGGGRNAYITGLQTNIAYVFRVRAVNSIGVRSPWSLQVTHVVAPPPAVSIDWTDVAGRPLLFQVVARGYFDTSAAGGRLGLYNGDTGAAIGGTAATYNVARIRRSDGAVLSINSYDVHASTADATSMATLLNSFTSADIAVVWTYVEPRDNRLFDALRAAMYRCGASPAIYGAPTFDYQSAYVLIGIGGCGEGNGFEGYADASVPSRCFVDIAFMLKGGNLIVTGSSAQPGTLADFGYTGTLDATTDIVLVARGNCVVAGNYGQKLGGVSAWDSDIYSRDSYTGGAYVSARPGQTTADAMLGLNSDPTTDSSYTSIDYAFYAESGAVLAIYESGAAVGTFGTYATTDILAIVYDGNTVSYQKNGVVLRSVAAAAGLTLFLDTSFYTPGAALANLRFGPTSAVTGIGTGQIVPGAATDVYNAAPGSSVSVTTQMHTPDGYSWNTIVRQITFTPSASGVAQVFFDARGNYVNGTGTQAACIWSIQDANAAYDGWKRLDGAIPTGATVSFSMGTTRSFPVTAGVPCDFRVYASRYSLSDTFTIDNIAMRVEVVKR